MKVKAIAVALALAGLGTSVAVAQGPPPGKRLASSPGSSVKVCHRTGAAASAFRTIFVSRAALETHMRHGDLMAPTSGGCSARAGGGSPTAPNAAAP